MTEYWPRDLDTFYISYDEPNSEENWARGLEILPDAKRIHRVKGFDSAHKACALASSTSRFMTIDGDNWISDQAFDQLLDDTDHEDVVFSFKSKNAINGLEYGNGGIKCWDRLVLLNSNTHENGDTTDFCWTMRYYQVDFLGSVSVNNATPFQAWRAGFREGVKMSYVDGKPMSDPIAERSLIYQGNRSKLNVWMTIGRDITHGTWAMLGARQGFHQLYNGEIENSVINDYSWFDKQWKKMQFVNVDQMLLQYARRLREDFDMIIPELDQLSSIWFKSNYMHPPRKGLML